MIRIINRDPDARDSAYEVMCDGQQYVSLQLFDATGDNALVYMTRAKALQLARHIVLSAESRPAKKTRSKALQLKAGAQ